MTKTKKIIIIALSIILVTLGGVTLTAKYNSNFASFLGIAPKAGSFEAFLAQWQKDNPTLDRNVIGMDKLKSLYESEINAPELAITKDDKGSGEYKDFEEFVKEWEKANPEKDKDVVGIDSLKKIYENYTNPTVPSGGRIEDFNTFEEYLADWEKTNPDMDKNVVGIENLKDVYNTYKSNSAK